jgi:predicted TIM-barrel fold metal-dependent hydrolase
MLSDDVKIVSVDDHVVEPPNVWVDRMPAKWRDLCPHVRDVPPEERAEAAGYADMEMSISSDGRAQEWVWEGRRYPMFMMGSPTTRRFRHDGRGDDHYAHSYDDMEPGAYEVKARLEAMDEDGIWAQLLFPTFPRFAGTQFLDAEDKDLGLAVVQAYNDWMIDEWCAAAPDRFIPMIITPLWDPRACAREIERCAAKGAKAIAFPENPAPLGQPSFWTDHWDPVFAAAAATGMPLSMHVGTSGGLTRTAPEASEAVKIGICAVNSMTSCADLIFSGMLTRHPDVKIAYSEGGSGWAAYLLERLDYTWERSRLDVDKSIRPTEAFQRNIWTCFISDRTAIELRYLIGVDKLMYETDYPHNDCNWPNGRKWLEEMLVDVPDDEARQIAELNARELYDFAT